MKQKLYFSAVFLILLSLVNGCDNSTEIDSIPPQISISFPIDKSTVSDSISIKATVADNDGISKVEFNLDGNLLASDNNSPYEVIWDTKLTTNGMHNIQCKAIDNSGNQTLSDIVMINVSNYLFKATFKNNWLPAEYGEALIFLSDEEGNVLSEKTWNGNDSFEMFLDRGLSESILNNLKNISVTTIVEYYRSQCDIITYFNIPVGSSWTWKGFPKIDYSDYIIAKLDLQNVPEHNGYIVSSKWSSQMSKTDALSLPIDIKIYEVPTDIYIELNTTNEGVQYYMLEDVVGGNRQEDLSTMNNTREHTISFQENVNSYQMKLYGVPKSEHKSEELYLLENQFNNEGMTKSISLYYPETTFLEYVTVLKLKDDLETDDFWWQLTFGKIPDKFTKINADFEFVSTSNDNLEFSTSGEYLLSLTSWWGNGCGWSIYGNKNCLKYKLPILPNSASDLFQLNRESFYPRSVTLVDHSQLSSYTDVLGIIFNSEDSFYDVVVDARERTKYLNRGLFKEQKQPKSVEEKFREPYSNIRKF